MFGKTCGSQSDGKTILVQDLPRSADHAANRTIFTWHIDIDSVRRRVATDLVQSIGNLRSRMEHEVSQRREVRPRVRSCGNGAQRLEGFTRIACIMRMRCSRRGTVAMLPSSTELV